MDFITAAEARENFSEIINRSAYGKERIILTRRGKNVVAVIPLEDLSLIEEIEDELDMADAKIALEEIKEHGSISLAEFKKKYDYNL